MNESIDTARKQLFIEHTLYSRLERFADAHLDQEKMIDLISTIIDTINDLKNIGILNE